MQSIPPDQESHKETVLFEPTRRAGLKRLDEFAARTGRHYASQRNYDFGVEKRSSVSALSPWIRHRLITEEEVLTRVLAEHGEADAMKFIQEVFWRGYFKGYLEQHPSIWHSYESGLGSALKSLERDQATKTDYCDAVAGRTGIACFDHWCHELKEIGYLHNHARMWFASIWIFTLRLPWELGADFFLNHLIDGDPASNTLSWRWVGGLHTKGKTYLARASNIAQYTNGRFDPAGQLSSSAEPLIENVEHSFVPLPPPQPTPQGRALVLITAEDCNPDLFAKNDDVEFLGISLPPNSRSRRSELTRSFEIGAVQDAVTRSCKAVEANLATKDWSAAIIDAAEKTGTKQVITLQVPVGPVASQLNEIRSTLNEAGLDVHQQRRAYDTLVWPHATKGFFKLKKKIPQILNELGFGL